MVAEIKNEAHSALRKEVKKMDILLTIHAGMIIHILLVVAVIVVLVRIIKGEKPW